MAASKSRKTAVQDPSLEFIPEIDRVDLKAMSYTQLRRLYARMMHAVDAVNEELTLRAEDDNSGDTVSVPAIEPGS